MNQYLAHAHLALMVEERECTNPPMIEIYPAHNLDGHYVGLGKCFRNHYIDQNEYKWQYLNI